MAGSPAATAHEAEARREAARDLARGAEDPLDPRAAAKAARLHYVSDAKAGIARRAVADGWVYVGPDGAEVTDEAEIARIRALAIPPAYRDVWICTDPRGHLQAVGRDARGRKQYRYHPRWREIRDEAKFGKMLVFGEKLPVIRARVAHDLALHGLPRQKVLAVVVRLLERTLARIGNEEYARTNKSFGLTTLRHRHARVKGSHVVLDFRAKHGIEWHVDLQDRRLAGIIARLEDLPGQELFQFEDHDGVRHGINSHDVNAYLHEITGEEITAKDFRTWAATNLAALALHELQQFDTAAAAKKNVVKAVEHVAMQLGNTPAICRKCYIHPAIFEGYLDGSLAEGLKQRADAVLDGHGHGLSAEEIAVTAFLSRRLGEVIAGPRPRGAQ
ncbi:MAG: DNA topoisomerase IB [Janthinobacterium lividum]